MPVHAHQSVYKFRHQVVDNLVSMVDYNDSTVNISTNQYTNIVFNVSITAGTNLNWQRAYTHRRFSAPFMFSGVIQVEFLWKPSFIEFGGTVPGSNPSQGRPYVALVNPTIDRGGSVVIADNTTTRRALAIRLCSSTPLDPFTNRQGIGMTNGTSSTLAGCPNLPVTVSSLHFNKCIWVIDTNLLTHTFTVITPDGVISTYEQSFTEVSCNINIDQPVILEFGVANYLINNPVEMLSDYYYSIDVTSDNESVLTGTLFPPDNFQGSAGTVSTNYSVVTVGKTIDIRDKVCKTNISIHGSVDVTPRDTSYVDLSINRTRLPNYMTLNPLFSKLKLWYDFSDISTMEIVSNFVRYIANKCSPTLYAHRSSGSSLSYQPSYINNRPSALIYMPSGITSRIDIVSPPTDIITSSTTFMLVFSKLPINNSVTTNNVILSGPLVNQVTFGHYGNSIRVGNLYYNYPVIGSVNYICVVTVGHDLSTTVYVNGVDIGTQVLASLTDIMFQLVGSPVSGLNGNGGNSMISELMVVDGVVSETTRHMYEGYLAHKFGLSMNLPEAHPYHESPP